MRLPEVAAAIERLLDAGSVAVVADPGTEVARLGLALDPDDGLAGWAEREGLDALVLHRSYGFVPPAGLGVIACHDPFDHRLGLAHNPWLHERLGLHHGGEPAPKLSVHDAPGDIAQRITDLFGGREGMHGTHTEPHRRVALADAMRADLVRAAGQAGATLYVTGTWRVPGAEAVRETGTAVLTVGHRRQERWSLALFAELLQANAVSDHVHLYAG